jgi:hypothetical protein
MYALILIKKRNKGDTTIPAGGDCDVDKEYNVENDNCGSLEIEKKLIKEGVKGKWGKKNIGDKLGRSRQGKHPKEGVKL